MTETLPTLDASRPIRDRAIALWLTYGRQDLSDQTARQLEGAHYYRGAIDNGSEPALERAAIRLPKNRLFVGGWNDAMRKVAGFPCAGYVWMLNDDLLGLSASMLEPMAERLREDRSLALITPAFNSPHPVFHRHGSLPREVRWIDWCCPVVSLEAWWDVGPFDERFTGYGADLDWCMRARKKGYRFEVDDRFEAHHLGSQTQDDTGQMRCVGAMNRLLHEKWGVNDWSQMV